jgi:hypothetical protein
VKQYAEELKEVDGMVMKKIASMARTGHVTTSILNGDEVGRVPDLDQRLAQQRVRLVDEVRAWASKNLKEATTRSGRKRRRDEDGILGEKKERGKKIKGETYLRTYLLVKEGRSAEEIATERGLSRGTIEGHIARGIAEEVLEIDAVMPAETRDVIAEWIQEHADANLNDARANFGDRFTYGQLRMVQAWLKKGD